MNKHLFDQNLPNFLKTLVARGNAIAVIQLLGAIVKEEELQAFSDDIIVLVNDQKKLTRDERMGLITSDDLYKQQNRIIQALLEVLNALAANTNPGPD